MYTVLLVDDDPGILNNLRNTIDWPVYGIEKVLEAHDGKQALELFQANHIDLLITDISMPNINGLELFRRIREMGKETRCILLSSYSDFDYAKEAIRLGVENYLMKPVNTDELDNTIRKALDNISLHRQAMHSIFMDNILYRWVTNDISPEELSERAKHIGLNMYFFNYCVVLLKSNMPGQIDSVARSILYHLRSQYDIYHFIHNDGYHVVILGGHAIKQSEVAEGIGDLLQKQVSNVSVTASVGIVVNGTEHAYVSYKSAQELLLLGKERSVITAQQEVTQGLSEYQLKLILDHLMSEEDDVDPRYLYNTIFQESSSLSKEEINATTAVLTVRLALILEAEGLISTKGKDSIICNTYRFEDEVSSDELLQWFTGILSMCKFLIKEHNHRLSPVILSAMEYIQQNYATHVSIKDFCYKYHANASYIGYLFRKETGIYFNDYINQVRINRSIELLKNSNVKISEISEMSGFNNTSYYIFCFKKRTGISPAKFRQILKKEGNK